MLLIKHWRESKKEEEKLRGERENRAQGQRR